MRVRRGLRADLLPSVVLGLALVLVFGAVRLLVGDADPLYAGWLAGAKVPVLVRGGQLWRLVSASIVHLEPAHVVVNAAGVALAGATTTRWFGWRRAWLVFGVGTLAGTTASQLWVEAWSVGASGGVFALVGATVAGGLRMRRGGLARGLPWVLAGLAVASAVAGDAVDHVAHAVGLAVGVGVGAALPVVLRGAPEKGRGTTAGLVMFGAALAYAVAGAAGQLRAAADPDPPTRTADGGGVTFRVPAHWVPGPSIDEDTCPRSWTDGLVYVCGGVRDARPGPADVGRLRVEARASGLVLEDLPAEPSLGDGWALVLSARLAADPLARYHVYARPHGEGARVLAVQTLSPRVEGPALARRLAAVRASFAQAPPR